MCYFFHTLLLIMTWFIPVGNTIKEKRKPNIVLILADDLGWMDVACYGNTYYETPNIDRLARMGIRFTNAYAAAPVCSPSRAGILTGKHPARLQLTNFLVGTLKDSTASILPANYIHHLPVTEETLAEVLRKNGYATGISGKWHLGGSSQSFDYDPVKQGFDFQKIVLGGYTQHFYPQWLKSGRTDFTTGQEGDYITERITQAGLKFIEQHQNQPFFLYLAQYAVHIPLQAREEKIEKYRKKTNPKPGQYDPTYAAMVESLDESVGQVLDKLQQLTLLENTIVIFASDNGGLAVPEGGPQPTTNAPLREGKGHMYEGGIRIPLIVYAPGKTKGGSQSEVPVIHTDLFPTIIELATGKKASAADGKSIVPLLQGNKKWPERPLFWHYPHFSNQGGRPAAAVRLGDYKLIELYENQKLELYHLRTDAGETIDLSGQMPGKVDELHVLLKNWRTEVNANMPLPNPAYR